MAIEEVIGAVAPAAARVLLKSPRMATRTTEVKDKKRSKKSICFAFYFYQALLQEKVV
eukprot:CAMPEP_0184060496 /NCGR_PEP_ID=MMETSP0956-20121227/10829_1 /TAXON_ID=627963 /ORGANISM="Aplanochytrium sp, Strain PBS07" /LENGTH=57 /DNA_ID=CAMNT_0026356567 /DNA_START=141 /DNA_END=311 /DNA_ORIENTATION=-